MMQTIPIAETTSANAVKGTDSFNNQGLGYAIRTRQSTDSKYQFSLDVYPKNDSDREAAELFIKNGFASAYGADIEITMPYVLAINNGKFKAALGIRAATENLFIEQYLAQPIEHYIAKKHVTVARKQIAEIGHLYSNSNKFTIPLFLTIAVSLFCNSYEYMVFAGTEHVVKLIAKAGIACHYIADADKNKLQGSSQRWGSYYDTNPQVVFVSLASVMSVVDKSKHFKQMFDQLEQKIAQTTRQIKG